VKHKFKKLNKHNQTKLLQKNFIGSIQRIEMDFFEEQVKQEKQSSLFSSVITFHHTEYIDCLKLSKDLKFFAYNCDKNIIFRDSSTFKVVDVLKDHKKFVSSICFNSDSFFSCAPGELFRYDLKERKLQQTFKINPTEKALSIVASDKYLIFYGTKRFVSFDLITSESYSKNHLEDFIVGNGIAYESTDDENEFFLSNDCDRFSRFNLAENRSIYTKSNIYPYSMAVVNDREFFWGGPMGEISHYDREMDSNTRLKTKHSGIVTSMSHRGNLLVTGGVDKHVHLLNHSGRNKCKLLETIMENASIVDVDFIPGL
jgi:WD40 repeat protein